MSEIKCYCTIYKVQSLVDNGIRVSIDLPETAIMQAAMFMECARAGIVLDLTAVPMDQKAGDSSPDGKKSRPDVKSLRGQ